MKITKLETFIVPPRWCFLKIETDEGILGDQAIAIVPVEILCV